MAFKILHDIDQNRKLWIVSDTHFYHHRLCAGYPDHFDEHRLYMTVEEMNEDIIENWNRQVGKNDQVIMLGDWMMNVQRSVMKQTFHDIVSKLNGEIIAYVRGNHDAKLESVLGDEVEFVDGVKFDYHGRHFICQHHDFVERPLNYTEKREDLVLVHGHTHKTARTSKVGDVTQNNVCWETRYALADADELASTNEDLIDLEVSDELYQKLKEKADAAHVDVATVVRNVLKKACDMPEDELRKILGV